jgi:hypothetical protein
MQARTWLLALMGAAMLSACSHSGTPHLMNLRTGTDGPDEFAILPPKALELPTDLAALPEPTPGGANLTDKDPRGDAVAALGGKSGKLGGIPAGDLGLVNYANRNGVTQNVREVLAEADLDWRKRHNGRLLERVFAVSVYYKAYRAFMLDQFAELAYWRGRGVPTPSAPPPKRGE